MTTVRRGRVVGDRGGRSPGESGDRLSHPDSVVPWPPRNSCDDEVADVGAKFSLVPWGGRRSDHRLGCPGCGRPPGEEPGGLRPNQTVMIEKGTDFSYQMENVLTLFQNISC